MVKTMKNICTLFLVISTHSFTMELNKSHVVSIPSLFSLALTKIPPSQLGELITKDKKNETKLCIDLGIYGNVETLPKQYFEQHVKDIAEIFVESLINPKKENSTDAAYKISQRWRSEFLYTDSEQHFQNVTLPMLLPGTILVNHKTLSRLKEINPKDQKTLEYCLLNYLREYRKKIDYFTDEYHATYVSVWYNKNIEIHKQKIRALTRKNIENNHSAKSCDSENIAWIFVPIFFDLLFNQEIYEVEKTQQIFNQILGTNSLTEIETTNFWKKDSYITRYCGNLVLQSQPLLKNISRCLIQAMLEHFQLNKDEFITFIEEQQCFSPLNEQRNQLLSKAIKIIEHVI